MVSRTLTVPASGTHDPAAERGARMQMTCLQGGPPPQRNAGAVVVIPAPIEGHHLRPIQPGYITRADTPAHARGCVHYSSAPRHQP